MFLPKVLPVLKRPQITICFATGQMQAKKSVKKLSNIILRCQNKKPRSTIRTSGLKKIVIYKLLYSNFSTLATAININLIYIYTSC